MAIIKEYTYQCTQADGSVYTLPLKGFTRQGAIEHMRESKALYTGCHSWKLISLGTTRIR